MGIDLAIDPSKKTFIGRLEVTLAIERPPRRTRLPVQD